VTDCLPLEFQGKYLPCKGVGLIGAVKIIHEEMFLCGIINEIMADLMSNEIIG
jgi:hypothetical protein